MNAVKDTSFFYVVCCRFYVVGFGFLVQTILCPLTTDL